MIPDFLRPIFEKLRRDAQFKPRGSSRISKPLSIKNYFALGFATSGGVGYIPFIPATWGSVVGVGVYLVGSKAVESFGVWGSAQNLSPDALSSIYTTFLAVFLIAVFLLGIKSSTIVVDLTQKKDPSIVVVDEVLGQLITLLLIPSIFGAWAVVVGFVSFRIFDIWKPFPVNRFEALPKGLGVMADDVMAGIYAGATVSLLCTIYMFALMF